MDMKEKAFGYIDEHRDGMMKMWEELVMMDSGSGNKPGVDAIVAKVAGILKGMGGKTRIVEHENAGNMLVSEFGDCKNKPFVIFTGHLDTVFDDPETTKKRPFTIKDGTAYGPGRPFTIKDGTAYGPGALDMKGGVTLAIHALQALQSVGFDKYGVKVILAGDEEVGHKHSDFAGKMMEEAKGAAYAFNFETGFMDDSLVLARKGVYCLKACTALPWKPSDAARM